MTLTVGLVLCGLIALNALYVAAEFSAVAVQRAQVAKLASDGNERAKPLLALLEDGAALDRYIAACQIGITLSSLVAGAYGQVTLAPPLMGLLEGFGLGPGSAASVAFVLVLLALTTLQVVVGELIPKTLALQFPVRTALATFLPTRWSATLFRGFIWLLNGSGLLLLRPFGIKPGGHQHVHSPEEIRILLAESRQTGALSLEAHRRLERGLSLSGRTVRQLMTPRKDVYAIEVSTGPDELLQRFIDSPYSRVPVYDATLDQVLGAVSTKDVIARVATGGSVPRLSQLLRPMPFVPETLRAPRFVRFLQEQQCSKAMVVDEFGGVQGIISIEDVLGELFGDVGDELERSGATPQRLPDGSVRLPGAMRCADAEPWLRTRWVGRATTVSGHIIEVIGRLPAQDERLCVDDVQVTIAEMGPTTVSWVLVHPAEPPAGDPATDATEEEG